MSQRDPYETDKLEWAIAKSQVVVCVAAILPVFFYCGWFFFFNDQPLSKAAETWGQFGDFFGGIANPLVAFAAFYWLTQSVKLQKAELASTRKALEEASQAQADQAEYAQRTVHLSALSSLVNATTAEIETRRTELQFLVRQRLSNPEQGARKLNGEWISGATLQDEIRDINKYIEGRLEVRYNLEERIGKILKKVMDEPEI